MCSRDPEVWEGRKIPEEHPKCVSRPHHQINPRLRPVFRSHGSFGAGTCAFLVIRTPSLTSPKRVPLRAPRLTLTE